MGYMKEKYTKSYFLRRDEYGNKLAHGVEGIEEFEVGGIRRQDLRLIERLNLSGCKILDIGFGRGEAVKLSLESGALNVTGVDFSESAVEIASENLSKYGLSANLNCADALDFVSKLAESSNGNKLFDIVLMLDFVEHIPRSELRIMLINLKKLLTDKAVLVINTPIFMADNDVIADGLLDIARDLSDDSEETAGMHCNRYTRDSLNSFMKSCGFEMIADQYYINQTYFLKSIPFFRIGWFGAYLKGFPISLRGLWRVDRREYAYSAHEIKRRERSIFRKAKRIIGKIIRR